MSLVAVGIDPGPATGIFALHANGRHEAYQAAAASAPWLLQAICRDLGPLAVTAVPCGIEGFVTAGKKLKGAYADITRDLARELTLIASSAGLAVTVRPAAAVKPWATDDRLRRSGIWHITGHGMAHARDAGRHAIYSAVHAGLLPDPLSKRWVSAKDEGE